VVSPSNFWQSNKTALVQVIPPGPTNVVQVDTNGTVLGPTNFWQANKTALLQDLPPCVQTDTNGTVTSPSNFFASNKVALAVALAPAAAPVAVATAVVLKSPTNTWRITISDAGVITATAAADVIVESRSGGLNYAAYSEVTPGYPNSWASSTSKSTAPGCSAPSIGSRYNSNAGIGGSAVYFQVAPTLPVAGGTYDLYVTVNSSAGTNVISTITQINCTGLPTTTTAFSVNSANVWTWVGTLTLGYGISTPTIRFDETANDYRFVADAVKFVYVR
jgi:hypothetical protein